MTKIARTALTRRSLLAGASAGLISSRAWAQQPSEVKVGLLVPISGLYARPGTVMREGAEMAVDHINAQGGIKSLGGAKLKLVVLDSGDTTEKAKNAAQRMVAQETDLVAASGAYLSSFTLAVTEVTERANLPVLTLSYSDLITDRGAQAHRPDRVVRVHGLEYAHRGVVVVQVRRPARVVHLRRKMLNAIQRRVSNPIKMFD